MAPPVQLSNPMFNPRIGAQHGLRSPVYRAQFIPSQQTSSLGSQNPIENYNIQTSEDNSRQNCFPESDVMIADGSQFHQQPKAPGSMEPSEISNRIGGPSASPQGQETRQHLRDLLQRQQVKKLEQDQISPDPQNTTRMWSQQGI